jgi:DNA-binding MarR family transcriptional regulator
MKEVSKELLNQMLVESFNEILVIQEAYMQANCVMDVTMNEIHVLEAIERLKQPTMAQVSTVMMVTPGTLTTSVKRLVQKGYALRKQDATDKRIYHLSITEKAKRILAIHDQFHEMMINGIVNNPEVDLASVAHTMESLLKFFHQIKKEYVK